MMDQEELNALWLDLEQAMGCLTFLTEYQHQSDTVTSAISGAERLVRQARERVANAAMRQELCT